MKRLTNITFWENAYRKNTNEKSKHLFTGRGLKKFIPGSALKALSNVRNKFREDFSNILLWDILLPRFLFKEKNIKIIEIGSAPGTNLIYLKKKYSFDVYGVEYTDEGYNLNRENFEKNDIDDDKLIKNDFFSQQFQDKYKESFDTVCSFGFIEHFEDAELVIKHHCNLLKPGGILIITVPNFRGIHYYLTNFFDKSLIEVHNLKIMKRSNLEKIIKKINYVDIRYLNYYGMLAFNHYAYQNFRGIKNIISKFLLFTQRSFHFFFKLFFKKFQIESGIFSPYLLFVGCKKS